MIFSSELWRYLLLFVTRTHEAQQHIPQQPGIIHFRWVKTFSWVLHIPAKPQFCLQINTLSCFSVHLPTATYTVQFSFTFMKRNLVSFLQVTHGCNVTQMINCFQSLLCIPIRENSLLTLICISFLFFTSCSETELFLDCYCEKPNANRWAIC